MFDPETNANSVDQKYFLAILTELRRTNELLEQFSKSLRQIANDVEIKAKTVKSKTTKSKTPTKKGGTKLGNSNKRTVQKT